MPNEEYFIEWQWIIITWSHSKDASDTVLVTTLACEPGPVAASSYCALISFLSLRYFKHLREFKKFDIFMRHCSKSLPRMSLGKDGLASIKPEA